MQVRPLEPMIDEEAGREVKLDVRAPRRPGRAHERTGLGDVRRKRAAAREEVAQQRAEALGVLQGDRLRRALIERDYRMILEVFPDAGQRRPDWNRDAA